MVDPSFVAPLDTRKFVQENAFSAAKNDIQISVARYLFVIELRFADKSNI